MARARNIKPGFFKNDLLAECEPLARLLFAGLWGQADRAGRLENRHKRLKAEILPYDDCDIGKLLDQLSARGFVTIYERDGMSLIQINKFSEHQNPHVKEPESTLPAPDKHRTSTGQAHDKPAAKTADSLLPITDSLNPIGGKPPVVDEEFETAWAAYPKRAGDNPKKAAFASWRARRAEGHEPAPMLNGVTRYRVFCKATGKLGTETVMQAKRFFGPDKPFLNTWEIPNGTGSKTSGRVPSLAERSEEAERIADEHLGTL